MHRDADGARLIGNGPADGLADPPRGVGRELVAHGVVKLFHRLQQPNIALLDQIQEGHAPPHIPLGDADHEAEVGLGELAPGAIALLRLALEVAHQLIRQVAVMGQAAARLIAADHGFGQRHLLIAGQEWDLADLAQIHAHGVVAGIKGLPQVTESILLLLGLHLFFDGAQILELRLFVLNALQARDVQVEKEAAQGRPVFLQAPVDLILAQVFRHFQAGCELVFQGVRRQVVLHVPSYSLSCVWHLTLLTLLSGQFAIVPLDQ